MTMMFLFFPIPVWIAITIAGTFGIRGISHVFRDPKKNKLGVLGMQQAGKTRFLSYLRGKPFIEGQTSRNSYDEFTYSLSNEKKIFIKSGIDIGGGTIYRSDYNRIIDESDVLLFFFNINKYLKNVEEEDEFYQRSCNSRFEHIYDKTRTEKQVVFIIATHKDNCGFNENDIRRKFDILVQSKSYKGMLKDVQYVNLTSQSEITILANKIFKI